MNNNTFQGSRLLLLDFGSQYTQLIARRVRELNVYCEMHPYNHLPENLNDFSAVILSGSPYSVRSAEALHPNLSALKGKMPLLAVCYGAQYLAHFGGGEVAPSNIREYGRAHLTYIKPEEPLFEGIAEGSVVWMSHSDTIKQLPTGAVCLASTPDVTNAAYRIEGEETYAIQFHPEVTHSVDGTKLLANFLFKIAKLTPNWTSSNFVEMTVAQLKTQIGNEKVILGLSGGVDSTVAAVLLNKAIGKQLHCIFVNNGLLRKNEFESVLKQYEGMGLNVKGVGPSATIKSHHNVGGLPDYMKLKVVEPLRMLFKDEVRRVGRSLGISDELLGRHPFPGPGLAIRILGDITAEKVAILQEVDAIFINALKEHNLYNKVWQAGAILLPINSVGVMGDERTYERVVALRAVESVDGMTADWVDLPYKFLQKVSNDIINKVKGVNRVVYDISSKPPATIEWE